MSDLLFSSTTMAAMTKRENYQYVIQCDAAGISPLVDNEILKKKSSLRERDSPKVSFVDVTHEKSLRRFLRQVCHHIQQ